MPHFNSNLAHLSQTQQALLNKALNVPLLTTKESKTGLVIPLLLNHAQPPLALHSLYDPVKEAQKVIEAVMLDQSEAATLVVAGFGGGFLVRQALAHPLVRKVIIIEPRLDLLASWLTLSNEQAVLTDSRVRFILSSTPAQALAELTPLYQPLADGNLKLVELRQITALAESFWLAFKQVLHHWTDSLTGELSSWAYFGTRWFKNIVTNLSTISPHSSPALPTQKHVCVVGAGPGLEKRIPYLRQRQQEGAVVIACDAVVMGLQQSGIVPEIIISIDAQTFVNLHFVGVSTSGSVVLVDLSLNPQLAGRLNAQFFAGNHPLSRLSQMVPLNTGGGNVGGAAYALAVALQATSIEVMGLDFKFIGGKPYARQVYIYPHFAEKSHRFNPSEVQSVALMFRHSHLRPQTLPDGSFATQPPLFAHYEEQFKLFCASPQQPVWQPQGQNGRLFLKNYRDALKSHRLDKMPLFSTALSQTQQQLWFTLWPSAATFYKQGLRGVALWQHNFAFALDQLEALAL